MGSHQGNVSLVHSYEQGLTSAGSVRIDSAMALASGMSKRPTTFAGSAYAVVGFSQTNETNRLWWTTCNKTKST